MSPYLYKGGISRDLLLQSRDNHYGVPLSCISRSRADEKIGREYGEKCVQGNWLPFENVHSMYVEVPTYTPAL